MRMFCSVKHGSSKEDAVFLSLVLGLCELQLRGQGHLFLVLLSAWTVGRAEALTICKRGIISRMRCWISR